MNSLIKAAVIAIAVFVPAIGFAQSMAALTRAQVRAELAELESVGYNPLADCPAGECRESLQQAEARLEEQRKVATAYGPDPKGTAQSGK
ncbi:MULTISPECIES: DUF4148 domain-containing protein [Burkholderia]|nr:MULTISPECIES: DUF4148 domain-containing protein [Burkholderia]MCA8481777.1 DUF4148 domain-containing protein [Burkholderia multivorans]MDR9052350.1 hypothetical protein [Burkholderia multivorans]MDR9056311.1 hypothetical protein [Burkholderia multivorans]MDR9062023.1 hypothetical protein [Burkholderia multivorans]MDR9068832.1 hypothetical protein [Burkholderia multivorans]